MRARRCELKPRAGRRTVRGARRGAYPKTPRQNTATDMCPFYHHNQFHCKLHCYQLFETVPRVQYQFVAFAHQPQMLQSQRRWAPALC